MLCCYSIGTLVTTKERHRPKDDVVCWGPRPGMLLLLLLVMGMPNTVVVFFIL